MLQEDMISRRLALYHRNLPEKVLEGHIGVRDLQMSEAIFGHGNYGFRDQLALCADRDQGAQLTLKIFLFIKINLKSGQRSVTTELQDIR